MSLQLIIGPLTAEEVGRALQALHGAGIQLGGGMQGAGAGGPMPPGTRPTALPPMVPVPAAPPPPPAPAVIQQPANPRLDNVIRLMDAYSKAGHQIAGVRKVLGVLQLQRAQDATEEQLVWLEQAFANTAWAP